MALWISYARNPYRARYVLLRPVLEGKRVSRLLLRRYLAAVFAAGVFALHASAGFMTAPTYPAGGGYCFSMALGDFNGDGVPDLAVTNLNTSDNSTVSILLGNGDGTFQAPQSYAVGWNTIFVAVGDFNGDGYLDIVVSNEEQNVTGTISVLLGNGDGTFQPAQTYGLSFVPAGLAVGDFDGDGIFDLAVCGVQTNTVMVMLGNGDGSFQAPQSYAVGQLPYFVAVVGFNGYGHLDLAVSNQNSDTVSILLGNGDGTFSPAHNYAAGYNPESVVVGDFNGGGILDLAVANLNNGVSILLGKGDGSFQAPRTIPGALFGDLAVGDFNGDGHLDLASGAYGAITILLGNGDGTFEAPVFYAASYGPSSFVAVGDLNGDGHPDLAVANSNGGTVSILLGKGDGSFQAARGYPPDSFALAVADVNGDGIADVVVTNGDLGVGTVSVFLGKSDGTLQAAQDYAAGSSFPVAVVIADMNGDGIPDLVIGSVDAFPFGNGTLSILLGNGDGSFQPPQSFPAGLGLRCLAVGDFNGDGKLDVVTANFVLGGHLPNPVVLEKDVRVFLGNGDGSVQAGQTDAVALAIDDGVAVADFNGDGIPDLAVGNSETGAVSILLGNGDGTFKAAHNYAAGVFDSGAVAVGDFNGDGILDLALVGAEANRQTSVSILLGNGDGTFQPARFYAVDFPALCIAVADFNRDGILDLAVSSSAGLAVLLGNGDGTFQAAQDYAAGAAGAVAVGDLNGDGFPDLALAVSSTVTTILINDTAWPP